MLLAWIIVMFCSLEFCELFKENQSTLNEKMRTDSIFV